MGTRYQSKIAVFLILTRTVGHTTEILLQRRCNTGYMDGMYDMACSGHVEKGESLSQAVVRESFEELGIQIEEHDLKLVTLLHFYQEDYLNVFFTTNKYDGIPVIVENEKCDDLTWFNIEELPSNVIPSIKNIIECMKKEVVYDDGDFTFLKSI